MASSSESPTTKPRPLQQRAYDEVKARLLSGNVQAGAVLSERQIASELGMSKTPVKAAFTRLDQEGFLKISPQHGVLVRDFTPEEMNGQMDLRIALESHVVRQLAQQGLSELQWIAIEDHLEKQAETTANAQVSEIVLLDGSYHLLLCRWAGNLEITKIVSQVLEKQYRVIANILTENTYRQSASLEEHRAIAVAIREQRGHLASELLIAHLERGKKLFTEQD